MKKTIAWAGLFQAVMTWANPFETGDASIATGVELKSGAFWEKSNSSATHTLPTVEVTLPVAAQVEATVALNYGRVEHAHGDSESGLHDMTLASKWRFVEATAERPALAIEPTLIVPTGDEDRGLGGGAWQLELPLLISGQIGAFGIDGKLGYSHAFGRDEDAFIAGTAISIPLNDTLTVGAEIAGDTPVQHNDEFHLRGNLGFIWQFSAAASLQGLLGKTLKNRQGEAVHQARVLLEYTF